MDIQEKLNKVGIMTKQIKFHHAIKNNQLEIFKNLLKDKDINPSNTDNLSIRLAAKKGNVEIVKILLKDNRVDPSDDFNEAINWASCNKSFKIIELLWQDKRVRNTLIENNEELYNSLMKKEKLKDKISEF